MTSPAPISSDRLEELWKRIGAALQGEAPLPSRIAEAAVIATGARDAALYLRERDAWVRTGEKLAGPVEPGEIPEPLPEGVFVREGELWLPLAAEGEVHGLLRLIDAPSTEPPEHSALLGFLFGSLAGAHRLARQVREAEFELKARLLERAQTEQAAAIAATLSLCVMSHSHGLIAARASPARSASSPSTRCSPAVRASNTDTSSGATMAVHLTRSRSAREWS